jgi:hypothetical protein
MYLLQQLAALIPKDALHEYVGCPTLVELAIYEDERFCSAGDALSLRLVGGGSFPSTNHSRTGNHQSGSSRFISSGWSIAMTSSSSSSSGFSPFARTEGHADRS